MAANLPAQNQGPAFLNGLASLTLFRQIGLMIGLAGAIALGVWVVLWSQEPAWKPLMRDVHAVNAQEVADLLRTRQIRYRIDANGSLLVEESGYHQAKIALAGAGITENRDLGFEILQQDNGFGTSQFMENARYLRSIEGELARTIQSFRQVRSARVHLAVPRQSVFVRDRRPPSASVFLELGGSMPLADEQIQAVTNLVANSVPELTGDRVSVVDQRGRLLSAKSPDPGLEMAARQLDYQREVEDRLRLRVESLLNRIVGPDGFRTELTVDLDFTQQEEAIESYDPTSAAVRSQRIVSEGDGRGGDVVGGIPGAQSNRIEDDNGEGVEAPTAMTVAERFGNGDANAPGQGGKYEEVRNFELERQMTYRRNQVGQIVRVSVAVAVDDLVSIDPDTGETLRDSWSAADLERLERLVREAAGLNENRGDTISIENTPFAELPAVGGVSETPIWQEPWVLNIARQVAGGLFVLLLLFTVIRPFMKRMTEVAESQQEGALAGAGAGGDFAALGIEGPGGAGGSTDNPLGLPNMSEEEADVNLPGRNAGYEKQLDAIRALVADDPGRAAQVIKEWLVEE